MEFGFLVTHIQAITNLVIQIKVRDFQQGSLFNQLLLVKNIFSDEVLLLYREHQSIDN